MDRPPPPPRWTPALALVLLACSGPSGEDSGDGGETATARDSAPADSGDSAPDAALEAPVEQVDVLVIGAGPAGLMAGHAAREAGATVRILEMDGTAGGAGRHAGHFFAAGTRFQAEAGIEDSPELALAEWAEMTDGDPDDPLVQRFVDESAALVEWLVDDVGAELRAVGSSVDGGSVYRVHNIAVDGAVSPVLWLAGELEPEIWLSHRAESLVFDASGAVIGARYTDLGAGAGGWVQAGSTVLATGGFARDLDRVLADRPELDGADVVFEAHPGAWGSGLDLAEPAGAAWQNEGRFGFYLHAAEDYREGMVDEALWPAEMSRALIVDLDGQRVADERQTQGFRMVQALADAPDKTLVALFRADTFREMAVNAPPYNLSPDEEGAALTGEDLLGGGAAMEHATAAEAASAWQIDASALQATVDRYEALDAAGEDEDFGKPKGLMEPFEDEPIVAMSVKPGAAKAFGGLSIDESGRVLDKDGQPVAGLYAAGEVAGMLGTPAVGVGFNGSITACFITGRAAGAAAAE